MTILVTPAADDDMVAIWRFVAAKNRPAADALIGRFDAKMKVLERTPHAGRLREGMADVRSAVIGRYLIFYRPIMDGVEVLRVLHGARDMVATLQQD